MTTGQHPTRSDPSASSLLDPRHRAFTAGIVAVVVMFAFEGIGVATAMPVVAADLGGLGAYAWAFTSYVTASLVGMVVAGEWCDARGPRLPLLTGIALFGGGAALCGLAWSMPALVAGRLVCGLGGGLGIVAVYVVLGRAYDTLLRPKAFALMSGGWVLPAIVGPFVAGALTAHVSWRAVFLLVVPFMVPPTLVLAPRLARLGGGTDHDLADPLEADRTRSWRRIRLAVVAAVGLAALQEAATRLGRWGLGLGALGLALLVPSLRRLLPTGTFRAARGLPTVVLLRGLMAGSFFAGETFVPLALQTQRGLDPTHAGLVLTAGAVGWLGGSVLQGRRHAAWGAVRLLQLGAFSSAVGLATIPLALVAWLPAWIAALSWAVGAFGMGVSFGTLGNQVLTLSAPDKQGENSAALQLCDSVGSVLLIGAAGAVYAAAYAAGSVGAGTYELIWWSMAAVMAGVLLLVPRVVPRAVTASTASA